MSEKNPYNTSESSLEDGTISSIGIDKIKQLPRFTTWAVVGLAIITLGIYLYYWMYSRTKKINKLIPENPIAGWLSTSTIVSVSIYYFISFAPLLLLMNGSTIDIYSSSWFLPLGWIVNIIVLVLFIVWIYSFRNRINQITGVEKSNKFWIGPILTFFFYQFYFQYKINQMHDKS